MSAVEGAARLASGRWTPFLSPAWGAREHELVAAYLRGEEPNGRAQLERAVGADGAAITMAGSGRAATRAVLFAAGFPPGSEVVLPSFSCRGVVEPVFEAGLTPVLVDVDEDLNADVDSVRAALGPRTAAVVVPHLAGVWSAARDDIAELARDRGLLFIEDAAQAAGLRGPAGQVAGLQADVGIFSTGVGKPLFGPGGGFAVVRDPRIADRIGAVELAEEHSDSVRRRIDSFLTAFGVSTATRGRAELGRAVSSRLRRRHPAPHLPLPLVGISEIEAALAACRWSELDAQIRTREAHARRWRDVLDRASLADLRTAPAGLNSFTKFWVDGRTRGAAFVAGMRSTLWRHGVETESLYFPLHLREGYRGCRRTPMPRTEELHRSVFSLPVRADLDDGDWQRIDKAVRSVSG